MTQPPHIPKLLPRVFHKFVHNGRIFAGFERYETNAFVQWANSIYNVAPASKIALSVVPLYGAFVGNPPPEKIDRNTSAALCMTGCVWTFYATLIQPQNAGSKALCAVNAAMGVVNGFNLYRRISWERAQKVTE